MNTAIADREDLIKKIIKSDDNFLVLGARKIGKTTFLEQIQNTIKYEYIKISFTDGLIKDIKDVQLAIFNKLRRFKKFKENLNNSFIDDSLFNFLKKINELLINQKVKSFILFLDDIEHIKEENDFQKKILGDLLKVVQSDKINNVRLIIASCISIKKYIKDDLFNSLTTSFNSIILPKLSRDQAISLLTKLNIPENLHTNILNETDYFPFLIKEVAKKIINNDNLFDKKVKSELINDKNMIDLFQLYYDDLNEECREMLIKAYQEKIEEDQEQSKLNDLVDYGYLKKIEEKNKFEISNYFFNKWLSKKHDPGTFIIPSADKYNNKEKKDYKLPYSIKQIRIQKYQCIMNDIHIDKIPVDSQWIVLTGENGVGKTSILQAIAIGLCGYDDRLKLIDDKDCEDCKIGIELNNGGNSNVRLFKCSNLDTKNFKIVGSDNKDLKPANNVVGYSHSRLHFKDNYANYDDENDKYSVRNLLSQEGLLFTNEYIFLKEVIKIIDQNKSDSENKKIFKKKKQLLDDILKGLLPHVDDIRKLENKNIQYKENGHFVRKEHLSAGHKSILGLVGDIYFRLINNQEVVNKTKDLKGIVIIDEIESHIHPKFQARLPFELSQKFPNVQFIVSTHSPLTFLGVPDNSVFIKVKRDEEQGTTIERIDIKPTKYIPGSLLTSTLFDMDELISLHNTNKEDFYPYDYSDSIKRRNELLQLFEKKLSID